MWIFFLSLFPFLKESEENKRQHLILRRNVCHLLFEGKKSHMGKLDIISFSGLNSCGTGRIESFFLRMLENVFPRVRSCEKLPASFLHFGFGFFSFFLF